MAALTPLEVAAHWPFVRENLLLSKWRAGDRALFALASAQVAADGHPARLGRAALGEVGGLTAGEAGNVWRALVELQDRGVVVCHPGRGRRPHAWSFSGDLAHWQRMPWRTSAKDVVVPILACSCRALRTVAAQLAGQSLAHMRGTPEFRLLDASALLPPALFSVETRHFREVRAAPATSHDQNSVETRGLEEPDSASIPLSSELNEEEEARYAQLAEGVRGMAGGRPAIKGPRARLRQFARDLTDEEAERISHRLMHQAPPPGPGAPSPSSVVEELIPDALAVIRRAIG